VWFQNIFITLAWGGGKDLLKGWGEKKPLRGRVVSKWSTLIQHQLHTFFSLKAKGKKNLVTLFLELHNTLRREKSISKEKKPFSHYRITLTNKYLLITQHFSL